MFVGLTDHRAKATVRMKEARTAAVRMKEAKTATVRMKRRGPLRRE